METRVEQTIQRHDKGYNCAQAVLCTYCDLLGLDENSAFKISEAFGLGMGATESTCGALSGLLMLIGLKNSGGKDVSGQTKAQSYKIAKEYAEKFEQKVGATICKDIKGIEDGKVKKSCPECIKIAASLAEEYLEK